jgi:hypothetical protein
MWLQELYRLYPEATWRYTGKRQDVAVVEEELSKARHKMRVGVEELRIIEESKAWTYQRWWPRLSKYIEQAVELAPDALSRHGKRRAIETLYEAFKHIEVVSVVLRFLCPEEFGILSPPVASLLNLSWAELEDQVRLLLDEGVLIATYRPGQRPKIPFPHFAEVWNALEYQFAAHLVYEGPIPEAVTVIETTRRRHDGRGRNPWNEPACGHHYARGISSWRPW